MGLGLNVWEKTSNGDIYIYYSYLCIICIQYIYIYVQYIYICIIILCIYVYTAGKKGSLLLILIENQPYTWMFVVFLGLEDGSPTKHKQKSSTDLLSSNIWTNLRLVHDFSPFIFPFVMDFPIVS